MEFIKNKNFYRFLIPSLIGIFLFVTPVKSGGNLTIPVAVMANGILKFMGNKSLTVIYILISLSAIITMLHKIFSFKAIKMIKPLENLFSPSPVWFFIRILGFIFATMIYFNIGPEFIIGEATGGLVINDLMPILVCVFFLAGILLPLLLNFGLLDFLEHYL